MLGILVTLTLAMSVPAKRRSRSRARRARNNRHLSPLSSLSHTKDTQDIPVPHRLRKFVERYATTLEEKRAARHARKPSA